MYMTIYQIRFVFIRFVRLFLPYYLLFFRLKEIDMSEYDAATYERFSNAVQRQVQSLRVILESLQVNLLCHF